MDTISVSTQESTKDLWRRWAEEPNGTHGPKLQIR
jgi:hypothetical protein